MKHCAQKLFAALLALITLSTSMPVLFTPTRAYAQIATVEVNPVVVGNTVKTAVESTLTAISTNASLGQQLLEWAQSFVLSTLKRRILDVMVDQVVTWIQGGGEPRFITDWESFLGDIGQGAVGEFVEKIGAGFLCEPFSLQIQLNLLPVQRFGNNAPFACTLDEIVQNVEDFYEDFRNGNWIAYNAQWQPQNNYYGALLIAWDARNNYVADKLAAAANNALANKGFLGTKRCYDVDTGEEVSEGAPFSRCEDTTPGGIVSATLEKAVGTDFDFIINAQQLGDYAAAIVNALVNRLIMEGVNGLRGVHQGSGASYQPSRPAGTTYGGYQSTGNIPGGVRGAINNYASGAQGSFAGSTRQDVIAALQTALQTRVGIRTTITPSLNRANGNLQIVDDTLACHATVASLQSGSIHDAILAKQSDAQNFVDFVKPSAESNDAAIDELNRTIAELTTLTDAQYRARANDFQAVYTQSDPAILSTIASQARQLSQQVQTSIADANIADNQRDLDYCISQGGTVAGILSPPGNFTATKLGTLRVRLTWTASASTNTTGYVIDRCQGFSCASFTQVASVGLVTQYDDNVPNNRTVYTYRIRSRDASNNASQYSRTATIRVD